jgi:membrane associated rhomboid family serine protease
VLPLSDHNPSRTTPVVNIILIAANVFFFFWELSLGPNLEPALFNVAFIPARFWISPLHPLNIIGMFVSMFLHGGWLHLGGNMLYLWIFGDNIEDRLGHFRYLVFYLLCGIVATLAHAVFNPVSRMPSIGASGAIAGVLGAIREIPAFIILGLWFVLQLFTGVASLGVTEGNTGGVAYFAHIGGFVAGMVLIALMGGMRRRAPRAIPYGDYWR